MSNVNISPDSSSSAIEINNISIGYINTGTEKSFPIFQEFNLKVSKSDIVSIFGPNASGKTTLLNVIAGTIEPDCGSVSFFDSNTMKPSIGYVFQNYYDTLLPWRTVRENIRLPLESTGKKLNEQERTSLESAIAKFNLHSYENQYIHALSGGLKQMVALARATIYNPAILLLDEPFSALDYSIARNMWNSFILNCKKENTTTILVSHNIDEAIYLGDRLIVLSGRPARIIKDIPINLGPNRDTSLLHSPDFLAIRKEILLAFENPAL